MGSITTAFPNSAKVELWTAVHNFTHNTGDTFKVPLIKPGPTGTYGSGSTNYSELLAAADEVIGPGYTAGGFAWVPANNITPQLFGSEAGLSWSVNPSWAGATFSVAGMEIYNSSKGNKAVYIGNFGTTFNIVAGIFTVLLPANAMGSSILALT